MPTIIKKNGFILYFPPGLAETVKLDGKRMTVKLVNILQNSSGIDILMSDNYMCIIVMHVL